MTIRKVDAAPKAGIGKVLIRADRTPGMGPAIRKVDAVQQLGVGLVLIRIGRTPG